METDLVGKIYSTLTKESGQSEADVRTLMILFRKILDNLTEIEQRDFLVLRLFSNWAVHNEITNSNTGLRILSAVNDALVEHRQSRIDELIAGISSEFGLEALRNQIHNLLVLNGMQPELVIEPKSWNSFIDHLIEIIRDVPISFPNLAKLDKKKQKIYDQISRNPIKQGAGVISIRLSNVDYDAAGAEGVGIVLCMVITTNDTTSIVVPFKKSGRAESAVA